MYSWVVKWLDSTKRLGCLHSDLGEYAQSIKYIQEWYKNHLESHVYCGRQLHPGSWRNVDVCPITLQLNQPHFPSSWSSWSLHSPPPCSASSLAFLVCSLVPRQLQFPILPPSCWWNWSYSRYVKRELYKTLIIYDITSYSKGPHVQPD